ncbi:MAG: 3D domain-containing protein [Chthoniobacter sp.]|nr:3D domain-containing protein [Chthoniobacter sp.]
MRPLPARVLLLAMCLFIVGCSTRELPKYQTPIARTQFHRVRTTAYTDTESDHVQYSNHNALGGTLQCGAIHSAAADWSRWPAGTIFRIRETGELYRVDDYGWALSGTNTIDLYKPSRATMNAWGVRGVTIENLQWGDPRQSLAVLRQRSHYRHVQRMIQELEDRMAELTQPVPTMGVPSDATMIAAVPSPAPTPIPVARPIMVASAPPPQNAPRAIPVTNGSRANAVARDPFFSNSSSR